MVNFLTTTLFFPTNDDAKSRARRTKNPFLRQIVMDRELRWKPRYSDCNKQRAWLQASAWEVYGPNKLGMGDLLERDEERDGGGERRAPVKEGSGLREELVRRRKRREKKVWGPRGWAREARKGGRLVRV